MKFKNIFSLFLAIIMSFSFASISYGNETDKELTETTVKEQNAEQRAEEILSSMTLEEKVAQMFMVYMPSKNAKKIQKKYQFGGYLLFADNFKNKSYSL